LAGEGATTTTVSRVETTPTGLSVDVCPSDYGSFPAEGPSLTCGCTPDAVKGGKIFGANPYYWQSSLCQAAVHAGLVDGSGGQIVVAPAPVTPVYPAVKRHGIESDSWRGGVENRGFRVTAVPGAVRQAGPGPAPHVDNAGEPVQAPVAETLRATGQVALYVRFRFNSADLDISGAATLMQLRDALAAAPDLRLLLVGHTDAVGSRDYNRNLSLRRAEAVMLWLRDQGIPVQRLAIDGKGYDEPIADNATDSGRSLNRRVQAIRIP
jgi:outer membrane protein OmpA-like peptidoglycan-associated protein